MDINLLETLKDAVNLAGDKKYTEFSKAIKQELHNKLANNKDVKAYVDEFDNLQRQKELFKQISNSTKPEPIDDNGEDDEKDHEPEPKIDDAPANSEE